MSGHNNILGAIFRELDQIRGGDEAIVWAGSSRYVYQVTQVLIVPEKYATPQQRAENAKWIDSFDDHRLTLVSCWPRNNNTHRVIVIAHLQETAQAVSH
jgi:LPXTG-site transpeptidase (sortase) family protein